MTSAMAPSRRATNTVAQSLDQIAFTVTIMDMMLAHRRRHLKVPRPRAYSGLTRDAVLVRDLLGRASIATTSVYLDGDEIEQRDAVERPLGA